MEQILLEEGISKHMKKKKKVQPTWINEGEIVSDEPESFCAERTKKEALDLDISKVSYSVSHKIFMDKKMKYGLDK